MTENSQFEEKNYIFESTQKEKITMEGAKPKGVGGNELGRNTAPVATSNNSDFGSARGITDTVEEVVLWQRLFRLRNLGFQGWSHEEEEEKEKNAR